MVVVSFNTYQAYNSWGGASLYALRDGTIFAPRVSFLRPYSDHAVLLRFLMTDVPLVRFLERWGYPVSYVGDRDFHADDAYIVLESVYAELLELGEQAVD